jgi:hypothetical protein
MDHDYELSSFKRNVYDEAGLSKSAGYYSAIRPVNAKREDAARAAKAASRTVQVE